MQPPLPTRQLRKTAGRPSQEEMLLTPWGKWILTRLTCKERKDEMSTPYFITVCEAAREQSGYLEEKSKG